jgi:hypothetical protein
LNEIVDDILTYITPRATWKQHTLVGNLEALKNTRKTHAEEWPDTYKQAAKNGKGWVERLEQIRSAPTTMRNIYSRNPKLLEWWDNI